MNKKQKTIIIPIIIVLLFIFKRRVFISRSFEEVPEEHEGYEEYKEYEEHIAPEPGYQAPPPSYEPPRTPTAPTAPERIRPAPSPAAKRSVEYSGRCPVCAHRMVGASCFHCSMTISESESEW